MSFRPREARRPYGCCGERHRPQPAARFAGARAALLDVLHDSLVLCLRDQKLAPAAFRDAMAQFGTPMLRKQLAHTPECAEVNIISSEDRDELGDGRKLVNGANWHTDDSFMREPCSLTMLYGVVVPSKGGDTQFTNMYDAYADLPAEMKARIDGLKVIHKYSSSRKLTHVSTRPAEEMAAMPEATHPLVRTHPATGRKSLYLNPNRMERIVGPGARRERPPARRADRPCDPAEIPIPPRLAAGRHRDLGQPLHDAQGQRGLSGGRAPPDASRDRGGDGAGLAASASWERGPPGPHHALERTWRSALRMRRRATEWRAHKR